MKILPIGIISLAFVSVSLSGCSLEAESHEESHAESHGESGSHAHKIIATSPIRTDVISTQPYVCQIHSRNHIEIRAIESGYLEKIGVNEGQSVKKGDLMFQIVPVLYQAKLNSEIAERDRIQIELNNAKKLNEKGIVSEQEIALKGAELAKAEANVMLARAELQFASVTAPFDGIVDRQRNQVGSLIEEGDILTTFSDNSLMWVYFNVPEARYLEYKAEIDKDQGHTDRLQIELKLANGKIFQQPGKIGAIEADFNNKTGNISFRADFPNPQGLLRNGQTGTILIHRKLENVVVIPQRAIFYILDKRYVYVIDEENVVHQRYITIAEEQDDIFVVSDGVNEKEKIIFEGIRQVRENDKIKYEFHEPSKVLANLKYHAE
ncbi:MAG: efflux RND transporter periplasmic adaptor subunit [Planctomycetaceae bacterium]|nr:efflux RND transporter periplasmic adaptor subunit [Planctomycetaceae bacterium]